MPEDAVAIRPLGGRKSCFAYSAHFGGRKVGYVIPEQDTFRCVFMPSPEARYTDCTVAPAIKGKDAVRQWFSDRVGLKVAA